MHHFAYVFLFSKVGKQNFYPTMLCMPQCKEELFDTLKTLHNNTFIKILKTY